MMASPWNQQKLSEAQQTQIPQKKWPHLEKKTSYMTLRSLKKNLFQISAGFPRIYLFRYKKEHVLIFTGIAVFFLSLIWN